jgi:hypothetical protein
MSVFAVWSPVLMPKTPMNKQDLPAAWEHEVRMSRESLCVESIAIT